MDKRSKIVVASLGIIAANLATLMTATFAWFSNNKMVKATGMAVCAKTDEHIQILEKKAYTWDYDTDTPIETDDLNLEPYDCFITSRNQYARKFLRLSLKYPNGIAANSRLVLAVEFTGALTYVDQDDGQEYVATNISNLIQFKYFDNKNNDIDDTTVSSLYSDCSTIFSSLDNATTIVTLSGTGDEQTASKATGRVEDNTMVIEATSDPNFRTDLFIEYTYNEALIAYYQKHAKDKFDLNVFTGTTEIEFTPDITKLLIDTTVVS